MNEEAQPGEKQFAERLAAFDEALKAGQTDATRADVPAEELADWNAALNCLRLLEAAWPRRLPASQPARLGDYQLLREVGRGGMGIVYEAEQRSLGRRVAIKVLPFAATLDPRQLQRFYNEAQAAAQLQHPHIVPVHAVACEEAVHFYVMQFIDGRTLAATIEQAALDPATAAQLGIQAAEALEHAHQFGVVHRDIKPANLLVDGRGCLWVADFGLALFRRDQSLTQTGIAVGTLRYMSPEQASAQRGLIDHRTDIYSLGVTLYEALTGRPAYDGPDTADLLRRVVEADPPTPRRLKPTLPADLETIVLKAIAKKPEERYATAQELADDLRRFLHEEPIRAQRSSLRQKAAKWAWRHRRTVRLAAALLLLLVLGLSVSTFLVWQAKGDVENALRHRTDALDREERTADRHRISRAYQAWSDGNVGLALELLQEGKKAGVGWEWHYLDRLCHAESMTGQGPGTRFHCVALSPDGQVLAAGGWDRIVRLWDANSGQRLGDLAGHEGAVEAVTFSPDGRLLAVSCSFENRASQAAASDFPIKVWDTQQRTLRHDLRGTAGSVRALAFSPDGSCLASGSDRGDVRLWDMMAGKEIAFLADDRVGVRCVAFSPDGQQLLVTRMDRKLTTWDVSAGKLVESRDLAVPSMSTVALAPAGQSLAAAHEDQLTVLDLATGQPRFNLENRGWVINAMAFSADGRRLATGGSDQIVRVWDAHTGQEARSFRGHTKGVAAVAFAADGQRLASAGADETVKVWQAEAHQAARPLHGHRATIQSLCWQPGPHGRQLASAGSEGQVLLWDVPGGRRLHTLAHPGAVCELAFSPAGDRLATMALRGPISLWDPATGQALRVIPRPAQERSNRGVSGYYLGRLTSVPSPGPQWGLAFDPSGAVLASSSWTDADTDGKCIQLWPVAGGAPLRPFTAQQLPTQGRVLFSPDGHLIWDAGDTIIVEERQSGQIILRCTPKTNVSLGLALSRDGRWLAAVDTDMASVNVWDLAEPDGAERRPTYTLKGHTSVVTALSWVADGSRLASTGVDGTIKLWDIAARAELLTLHSPSRDVYALAFSPDGKYLASGSKDGTVWIWDGTPRQ